ncbi:MAG: peptidoglycan-binding protein [Solirubrobacterales bacterium]
MSIPLLRVFVLCGAVLVLLLGFAGNAQAYEQPRNLAIGSQGEDVAALQTALNTIGYSAGKVDGFFGPITQGAVIRFQSATKLKPDGIAGPKTSRVLSLALNEPINEPPPTVYKQVLQMRASAYDDDDLCNYPYTGQPSYIGLPLMVGVVAVDPKVIPLGSQLWIEGYGPAIAGDVGGAIKGTRLDLLYPFHQSAWNYGIQNVNVYIL